MVANNSKTVKNAKPARKAAVIAAETQANLDFANAKQLVLDAMKSVVYFDWKPVKDAMQKYSTNLEKFTELRLACFEHSIMIAAAKASVAYSETKAHELARHNGKAKDARELSQHEKDFRTAARNAWFYLTNKCEIKSPDARGGAHNPKGKNAAKPKATVEPSITDSYKASACDDMATLIAAYDTFKHGLIKLQARNAGLYTGDMGSKLLDAHKAAIAALNAISKE